MTEAFWPAPFIPGLSALILFLFGSKLSKKWISIQASLAVLGSFLLSVAALIGFLDGGSAGSGASPIVKKLFTWIAGGSFSVQAALAFDPLAAVMVLVVTGVGLLIHVYSAGYMADDTSPARYFGLLNLFIFFMLILVLASNLILMFVGWEGVGLCSYLLIGFWYEKPSAASAGKKAFIVNRVGDSFFLIGILLVFVTAGSVEFADIAAGVSGGRFTHSAAALSGILFFIGATAKSAQIPLYIWLPDAMEGPTPVSALIHAATMVTAGVYMVCRMNALYAFSETASLAVTLTGAMTAFFAATLALTENDIKRVLAYSTISQIGYMFIGCGVGAYAAGMFHLFTHAFFKSLLFLSAGSVIHALSGEQNLTRMGGLKQYLPRTYRAFVIGAAAIAGVPFFSGFFSKDAILSRAFAQGRYFVWILGLATAVLTAFYIFRLIFLVFYGRERSSGRTASPHESPSVMTIPLSILALFSIAAGYIGLPAAIAENGDLFKKFLTSVFPDDLFRNHLGAGTEWKLMLFTIAAASAGILAAYSFYVRKSNVPVLIGSKYPWLFRILNRKFFVDEAVEMTIVRPLYRSAEFIYNRFDVRVVDGALNGSASAAGAMGKILNSWQTGLVTDYALAFLLGTVLFLGVLLL